MDGMAEPALASALKTILSMIKGRDYQTGVCGIRKKREVNHSTSHQTSSLPPGVEMLNYQIKSIS